jgi:hypothetical protein
MKKTDLSRDWDEDFDLGSNRYECPCSVCKRVFFGDKRRVVCRRCAAGSADTFRVNSYPCKPLDVPVAVWRPTQTNTRGDANGNH